jgi:hypothetical protein
MSVINLKISAPEILMYCQLLRVKTTDGARIVLCGQSKEITSAFERIFAQELWYSSKTLAKSVYNTEN